MSIQSKSAGAAQELERYFETPANYAHANTVGALVLEPYGAGYAWLRSEEPAEDDEALFTITDAGRDYLRHMRAREALFAPPRWPTRAEPD